MGRTGARRAAERTLRVEFLEGRQLLCGGLGESLADLGGASSEQVSATPALTAAPTAVSAGPVATALVRASSAATTPTITISDASRAESDVGQNTLVFVVNLSEASSKQVSVKYATANGTARTGDGDFVGKSGTLTFLPGETTKTISVSVKGDTRWEQDEELFVNLSRPRNASLADARGVGTILDDDSPIAPPPSDQPPVELTRTVRANVKPAITVSDVALAEGNSGSTSFVFTVSLSTASSKQVSVNYATANGTARTGDGDFVGKSGTLTFLPGETTKTITVWVNGDTRWEPYERFFVNLSGSRNAVIADSQGIGTILNDDQSGCSAANPCNEPDPNPPGDGF